MDFGNEPQPKICLILEEWIQFRRENEMKQKKNNNETLTEQEMEVKRSIRLRGTKSNGKGEINDKNKN